MKISLNTLTFINQHYNSAGNPAPNGVADLVEKIGSQLGAIEETVSFGDKYQGVIIATIVTCQKHADSDHLNVCMIDDGGASKGVERDENGLVQVVCGAPNARAGITVAWLPPGSTVPESYGTSEPFVLSVRPLRGVSSNGMLASPRELALGAGHDGILEITQEIAPGTSFAEAFNLVGDVIIDIENKMFTHRPDCFGILGVARELEGIQRRAYKSPDWYTLKPVFPSVEADELKLEIINEIPELVPRFMAAVMQDVHVGASPMWLQIALAKVGIRSINNIVDYTNFFMLETGQPLHAYDYDKVVAQDTDATHATLVIRKPKKGENIMLLSGKEIEPRTDAIMIATRDRLIGLGGVMGGADTEVDENTKNIIIECANFDMYSVRRTSMVHGLFTDAVTRFNKGQSPLQNAAVLAKIIDKVRLHAHGKLAAPIIDDNHLDASVTERGSLYPAVTITREFIMTRLGIDLNVQEIATLLTNVEFTVDVHDDTLTITAPFWRTDIEIREDIVEEVGRLYGFDHLPQKLPQRDITPAQKDPLLSTKALVRDALSKTGANEVLTYSFVHGNLLEKAGQDTSQAFRVSNALSPELQYFRMSITPSILDKVHANIKAGNDQFALFEINKAHNKDELDDENLPLEAERVALVFAANKKAAENYEGAAYYQARTFATTLLHDLGLHAFKIVPYDFTEMPVGLAAWVAPFAPERTAAIVADINEDEEAIIGIVGEYTSKLRKGMKLPEYCAGFELDVDLIKTLRSQKQFSNYTVLSRFPRVEQDICFKVTADIAYQDIVDFVHYQLKEIHLEKTITQLTPVDIYQRNDDMDHKQITLRFSIAHFEKTMTDTEVSTMLDTVAEAVRVEFGAERI